jgi:formylglycine-generating enzyme required for sulfatase activity
MIGNLWEWVDTCDAPGSAFQMATVGASVLPVADTGQDSPTWVARLPVAPLRAGYWSYGTYAGAISPATVTSAPYHDADIGVRCCVGGS